MKLVLASASPRRRELLRMIGLDPEVIPPDIEEKLQPGESTERFLERVSIEKGMAVYRRALHAALIVSADTIVLLDGRILGKPAGRLDARAMLLDLGGRRHQVWTGLALMHRGTTRFAISRTEVSFRPLEEDEVDRYLDTEHYQDKAGAYAIQGRAAVFVESIHGCYFNVMGFPLSLFDAMLREQRIRLHG